MHKTRFFLMFFGLIMINQVAQGQVNDSQPAILDSVYLKSGKLYEGVVSKHIKGQYLRMFKTDGKEVVIGDIDIAKIIDNNQDAIVPEPTNDEPVFQVEEELSQNDIEKTSAPVVFDENIIDVIHLSDGSILRGKITEYIQGESLTIVLTSGTELTLAEEEIEKVRQELPEKESPPQKSRRELRKERGPVYVKKESGWYNATYLSSYNGRLDGEFEMGLGFNNVFGYQFNRFIGLGLGIGLDAQSLDGNENLYPIFLEWRGYFTRKVRTPYYSISGGYNLAFKNKRRSIIEAEGGYLIHPAIGYRVSEDSEVNVLIDIGYRFQRATFVQEEFFEDRLIKRIDYRRFTIRLGLIF